MPRTLALALPAALALAAPLASGCGALATSPSWAGGGMAVTGPARAQEEEAAAERKRAIIARQPKRIAARHLLIMHAGSLNKPDGITRTREQARVRAQEALLKIRGGATFEDIAKQYSDEPGASESGGLLGAFNRDTMVEPFADAAFALKVNEVSEIVETKFGFHVIKRIELPPAPAGVDVAPPTR